MNELNDAVRARIADAIEELTRLDAAFQAGNQAPMIGARVLVGLDDLAGRLHELADLATGSATVDQGTGNRRK